MRPARERSLRGSLRRHSTLLAACVLGAACGDATGSPIRGLGPTDAATPTRDAMPDAASGATLQEPDSNDGSDSMHDERTNDVPYTVHCANAANWDYVDSEQRLEDELADLRQGRVRCGNRVVDDLPRMRVVPELRCSARLHSLDMFVGKYFDSETDGDPGERMTAAGFDHHHYAESIVRGEADSSQVLQVLRDLQDDSEGCKNLTNREFTALGIGNYAGLWTFDFAEP